MQKQQEEVMIEPGDQCCNPYECWYWGYCHQTADSKKERNRKLNLR